MNTTALLDILSARATADNNSALLEMLARMRDGSASGSPNTQELLAQLAQDNPMLGVLAQHMAARSSVVAEMSPVEIRGEPLELESATDTSNDEGTIVNSEIATAIAEIDQLRAQLQAAHNELSALRDREDVLAEALGACCLCWGEDGRCRACRGRGRPGFAMPDEEAFGELVLPAVRMFRAGRIKQGVIAPMTSITNSAPGASSGALRHT
jgi:hypothetical protein